MTVHIMRLNQVQRSLIRFKKHGAILVLMPALLYPGVGVLEDIRLTEGIHRACDSKFTASKTSSLLWTWVKDWGGGEW